MYRYGAMQKAGGAGSPSALNLGPELIDDTGFDVPTAWNTPAAIIGSQLDTTGLAAPVTEALPFAATIGTTYYFEIDVAVDAGTVCIAAVGGTTIWTIGDGTGLITGTKIAIGNNGFSVTVFGTTSIFNSISVKEVL